jgi:hypothetical protein
MTWDRRLYFPAERRRAEDFFALRNPAASAGFEPANLGTKGQHATSRPPQPLAYAIPLGFKRLLGEQHFVYIDIRNSVHASLVQMHRF